MRSKLKFVAANFDIIGQHHWAVEDCHVWAEQIRRMRRSASWQDTCWSQASTPITKRWLAQLSVAVAEQVGLRV